MARSCGLPLDRPLRVLDVGGGRGVLRDQVEAATAWTVDLVELNLAALEAAAPGRGRHLYYDVRDRRPSWSGATTRRSSSTSSSTCEDPLPLLEAVAGTCGPVATCW